MRLRVNTWLCGWLLGLLSACYSASSGAPTTKGQDGKTGWLSRCNTSIECGTDLSCSCGVCTRTCTNDSACGALGATASCVAHDALQARCEQAAPTSGGLCLPQCSATQACATGYSCSAGHCLPPIPTQVGGADAGNGLADAGGAQSGQGGAGDDAMVSAFDAGKRSVDAAVFATDAGPIVDGGILSCPGFYYVSTCQHGAFCCPGNADCIRGNTVPCSDSGLTRLHCGPSMQVCTCQKGAYCAAPGALCIAPNAACP